METKLRWTGMESFLKDVGDRFAGHTAFSHYRRGRWETLTYASLVEKSRLCAHSLRQSGLAPGDRVAILGSVSLDWPVHFFAASLAGAVLIPLDQKLSEPEILGLLRHANPRFFLVSEEFRAMGFRLRSAVESIEKLLYLEEPAPVLLGGLDVPFPARSPRDCAAVFYTSGTLGAAKGVMVSFENLFAELTMLTALHENSPADVMFSILPLNHLYGLTAGVLYSMACGSEYCFAHGLAPPDIALCLNERRVTQMVVVPLLLNLMRRGILKRVEEEKPLKRWMFRAMLAAAPLLPLGTRRKLFAPLHARFGGRLRRMVSGAAPLDSRSYEFFRAVGMPVYEGYGLTETGPVISVNTTRHVRKGTVGRPLAGVEVKVVAPAGEESGEICTRGPHVMLGYLGAPELTRQVIDEEGWFHTGDIGRVDAGGYLRITGRQKSLIVLESGKKVHSEEVEQALQHSPNFQDVCVLGIPLTGQGEQVVAVVHPAPPLLEAEPDAAALRARVEAEVTLLCRKLAPFKRPARVVVRTEPLPKTTSGKVKRHVLKQEIQA